MQMEMARRGRWLALGERWATCFFDMAVGTLNVQSHIDRSIDESVMFQAGAQLLTTPYASGMVERRRRGLRTGQANKKLCEVAKSHSPLRRKISRGER